MCDRLERYIYDNVEQLYKKAEHFNKITRDL